MLDAACGTGYGTAVLAAAGAVGVTGLDVSDDALRAARAACPAGNVSFQSGDVCALAFPDGAFDLYVSFETVEHLPDPARYAHEARRVLAPDGVFPCSTPNRPVSNPGTGIGDQPYNPFHVREYDAAEFAALLGEAFPVVEVYGQSLHPAGYVRGLGRVAGWSRRLAVRSHQMYKAARSPIDRSKYHRPQPYTAASEPGAADAGAGRLSPGPAARRRGREHGGPGGPGLAATPSASQRGKDHRPHHPRRNDAALPTRAQHARSGWYPVVVVLENGLKALARAVEPTHPQDHVAVVRREHPAVRLAVHRDSSLLAPAARHGSPLIPPAELGQGVVAVRPRVPPYRSFTNRAHRVSGFSGRRPGSPQPRATPWVRGNKRPPA